ncbi:MAG TPA: hypothetical protein VMG82_32150 [Candidatus Sulfotelmatobacter sp.]|nr:hypothetical protein [Candidatus Sulfotelmatobacter sp.]
MLNETDVKEFVLESVAAAMVELGQAPGPLHGDLFDDQTGASPGRIASFELDKHGKLTWWNWRSEDACGRADFPLKLKIEFAEDERRTVWLRGNSHGRGRSWDIEDHRRTTQV